MANARAIKTAGADLEVSVAQFAQSLQHAVAMFPDEANTIKRKAALSVLRAVIKRSPVKSGRFRNNWQMSVGRPKMIEVENWQGHVPLMDSAVVATVRPGQALWLTNNVPYAMALEAGHSKQAPAGVLAVTLAEVRMGLIPNG